MWFMDEVSAARYKHLHCLIMKMLRKDKTLLTGAQHTIVIGSALDDLRHIVMRIRIVIHEALHISRSYTEGRFS